ncbi:family 1 encapsulin nanocompartment shell protein [Amycolatopsis jiangsuensis]|uniref:Type 1 encapsulin shell protein n=1 Tax=Amycolatopsis jiangsuensis TaxID=1181879 RepID=A0A840IPP3_9PSEU|nr:family 1 encapsulin nanocompartment shell protein [Amycolatopsis jiangsuensis]MBB4684481.1 putative linocin/CFP29 family protein [Amycolatopsis jiangsuensis]
MNHLMRELAPIPAEGWRQIDDEARERLATHLAARKMVDVEGPHGWTYSATSLGRTQRIEAPQTGTQRETAVRRRRVLPLVEVRVPFTVDRAELENAERGADDLELDDLDQAAAQVGLIENRAVFHGWPAAEIGGIVDASPYDHLSLGTDPERYPHLVANAVNTLRCNGIGGPYALAINPDGYTAIVESTEHGGLLVLDHLRRALGGGRVKRTPGIAGAVVLSLAGGDFVVELGQDLSVGYSHHDAETLTLYLEESFSFRVTEPDAAIVLD